MAVIVAAAVMVGPGTANAQDAGSPIGDLTGNWPWTVWLLIPFALLLGLVTAFALGATAEPENTSRRRGVSHALDRREVARPAD
ncbi:MAG: hypothetical protein L0221_19785 [Chloroflexi bacterium]|nr:hypothetical protein [Chloroflexota bacterium]